MAAALAALGIFILLAAAITFIGYRRYVRPAGVYEQIGGTAAQVISTPLVGMEPSEGPWTVRVLELIGEKVPVAPADATATRRYLMAAGYRSDTALAVHYGIKVVCCVVFFLLGFALNTHVTSVRVLQYVFLIAATAGGYFGPNLVLERLVTMRQERIRFGLPDALDLMVISVEAGLGLDQAVVSVARELSVTHKDLSDEFKLVTLEMRAGKRRAEALKNLVDRTGEGDLRKLVAILLQTDRFGTSMAESLRSHSDFMRMKRTQEAEERANKVGVKLIFPIFFFILPAMILVAAGPAVIQIFRVLIPLMRQIRH
jgi:tight adherence protein C